MTASSLIAGSLLVVAISISFSGLLTQINTSSTLLCIWYPFCYALFRSFKRKMSFALAFIQVSVKSTGIVLPCLYFQLERTGFSLQNLNKIIPHLLKKFRVDTALSFLKCRYQLLFFMANCNWNSISDFKCYGWFWST